MLQKGKHNFEIASLHFHNEIFDLFSRKSDGKRINAVSEIPATLAHSLSSQGCAFTPADRHEDGTYVPLPNYPVEKWEAYVSELEKKAVETQLATPKSSKVTKKKADNQLRRTANENINNSYSPQNIAATVEDSAVMPVE